jgi:transcriptional regulator with XRE-family HTH domain
MQLDFSANRNIMPMMLDVRADGWRERLLRAIEADGRSSHAISRAAGLGPNYISQLRLENKEPGINQLIKLAEELDVSLAWLLLGVNVRPADEQFFRLFQETPPQGREAVVSLLKALHGVK